MDLRAQACFLSGLGASLGFREPVLLGGFHVFKLELKALGFRVEGLRIYSLGVLIEK